MPLIYTTAQLRNAIQNGTNYLATLKQAAIQARRAGDLQSYCSAKKGVIEVIKHLRVLCLALHWRLYATYKTSIRPAEDYKQIRLLAIVDSLTLFYVPAPLPCLLQQQGS